MKGIRSTGLESDVYDVVITAGGFAKVKKVVIKEHILLFIESLIQIGFKQTRYLYIENLIFKYKSGFVTYNYL